VSSGRVQLLVVGCPRSTCGPVARGADRFDADGVGKPIRRESPESRSPRMPQDRRSRVGMTWETLVLELDRVWWVDPSDRWRSLGARESAHEAFGVRGVGRGARASSRTASTSSTRPWWTTAGVSRPRPVW